MATKIAVTNADINFNKFIKNKLFEYQVDNATNVARIIQNNGTVLDASDTGTGKTYTAVAACAYLKLRPFVICPKSVIFNWRKVCAEFKVEPVTIVNYESIRMGKEYSKSGRRVKSKHIEIENIKVGKKKMQTYRWHLPKDCVVIFDEVHKCTNLSTLNGKLLMTAKESKYPMVCISATVADTAMKFRPFFYVLNFIDPSILDDKDITMAQYFGYIDRWILRDANPMIRIHKLLYPARATRMRIDILGNLFPDTQIVAASYTLGRDREKEIQKEYETIRDELDKLGEKTSKDRGNILVKVMRAHQKIELLKIPTFVELAKDFIENGFSIVIFVNFTQTLESIASILHTDCLIHGTQKAYDRQNNIDDFQSNKKNVIICNIKAGGVGISLHDIHGGHPRISLISPTWSSIDLLQALGRVHRAGGKTKSLQRIIYTANTIEERIADKVRLKLKDINSLNNGDLDLTNIEYNYSHKTL